MKQLVFGLGLAVICLISCNRELDEVRWDADVLAPLARTSISINQLTADEDSIFSTDDENQVTVVFTEDIYRFDRPLDSLVTLSVLPFTNTVTLQSLVLSAPAVTESITVADLSQSLQSLDQPISLRDGGCVPNIIFLFGVPAVDLPSQTVDVTDFFEEAVLQTGTLNLSLDNGFTFHLDSAEISIRNAVGGQVLYEQTITDVAPGESFVDTYDLAAALGGQPIEGNLTIDIGNIKIGPPQDTTCALIDFEDEVSVSMSLTDLTVESASAIFPAQNVVDNEDTVSFTDMGDVELTRIIIDSAKVRVRVFSTIPTKMFFSYEIPAATLDGEIFSFDAVVPAAEEDTTVIFDEVYPFQGYEMDLTGPDGDLTNTFWNTLVGRIDSTGEVIDLSLSDTISIELTIEQLTARYAEGYLGQEMATIGPDTIDLDVFDFVQSGSLNFENVDLNFIVENGLGVDASVSITDLSTLNSAQGSSESLSPLPDPFTIAAATNNGTGADPVTTTFAVENATSVLNILPNKAIYEFEVGVNPGGNNPLYGDFVYNESGFKARLDMEIPLSIQADELLLRDTVDIDFGETEDVEAISSGVLKLVVQNEFPMDASLEIYMMTIGGEVLDTLNSSQVVEAGIVGSAGRVTEPTKSTVEFELDAMAIDNLLLSKMLMVDVTFDSQPSSDFVRIYDDYTLDISVVGDFEYQAQVKL